LTSLPNPGQNGTVFCDHEGNYFDYKTLFAAFYFSVLSVRTFVYVDYLPLIFSMCVNSTLENKLDIVSQIMFFSFIFFLKEILCTTPVGQFDFFTFQ
jgi:hypothetical protein